MFKSQKITVQDLITMLEQYPRDATIRIFTGEFLYTPYKGDIEINQDSPTSVTIDI